MKFLINLFSFVYIVVAQDVWIIANIKDPHDLTIWNESRDILPSNYKFAISNDIPEQTFVIASNDNKIPT